MCTLTEHSSPARLRRDSTQWGCSQVVGLPVRVALPSSKREVGEGAEATGSLLVVILIPSLLGTQMFNYTELHLLLHGRPWLQSSALSGREAGFLSKGLSGHTVERGI